MKARQLLKLFTEGFLYHETISTIKVEDNTDLEWLVGAVDKDINIPKGEYLVYYKPITNIYDEVCYDAEYTLHDEYGNEIYLLKIED